MPDKKPAPITAEGRRAAERVRTIFYSIAAANIVIVAAIMWLGKGRKEPANSPAKSGAIEKAADDNSDPEQQGHSTRSGEAK